MKIAFQKHDGTLAARLIRLWTWSPYSHCEIIFEDGYAFSSHIRDGGTRYTRMPNPSPAYWDVYPVPCTASQEAMIRAFCDGELGCKYDLIGIYFSQILPLRREHPDKWFCSEICAAILKQLGFFANAEACEFSPGSLHRACRSVGIAV